MTTTIADVIKKNGEFYSSLNTKNNYNINEKNVMENTITKLLTQSTSSNKPGMLLGNIQSGKTRSFIGAMALGFDNGYEIVLLLTKNSNALVKQTYERLENEFENMIEQDKLAVYDIMKMPTRLANYELKKKLVIVLKKEKKNMERIENMLFNLYPILADRKILFVDDEADFASVAYESIKEKNIIELKVIASQIDSIRSQLSKASYLQVTATPYSLYLQPDDMEVTPNKSYQPKRPAFTELVPIHDKYVGGDIYFNKSEDVNDDIYPIARHLFHPIKEEELKILENKDRRKLKVDKLLTCERYEGIRSSLINFIVGGKIRNIQQLSEGANLKRYAFIMHTMTSKKAHQWQAEVVIEIQNKLVESIINEKELFEQLIKKSYDDFEKSRIEDSYFPVFEEVLEKVKTALKDQELLIEVVNSEQDVDNLLDKTGQLKLRTPLNVFIGGQILDRGITIGNLIGFYYGRNPKKSQQDTVSQHSRMYGARPMEDIAVTRFYTTKRIHDIMKNMHEFDTELRASIEKKEDDSSVMFVRKDVDNRFIPCSPNKILLSSINVLKPSMRILPVGFQTIAKTKLDREMKKMDSLVKTMKESATVTTEDNSDDFLVKLEDAVELLTMIKDSLVMEEEYEWDFESYIATINYLYQKDGSKSESDIEEEKYIWIVLRKDRNSIRYREEYARFVDNPDGTTELRLAKSLANEIPALILTRQNGAVEKGWKGAPFYWPVLVTPQSTKLTIFADKTIK